MAPFISDQTRLNDHRNCINSEQYSTNNGDNEMKQEPYARITGVSDSDRPA